LRRTDFLRPEGLLPVSAVAKRLGFSAATVYAAINAGRLRSVLFGSVRRVRPEDLEGYEQSLNASRPPAGEDWCTVAYLMRVTHVSRSHAYRLLARGTVPFQVFAGVRRIRREDIATFVGRAEAGQPKDGTA
jgi:excisionase family DNA binding protein